MADRGGPATAEQQQAWLLLADPSPALRHRVLTEFFEVPDTDAEVCDLAEQRAASAELRELIRAEPADLKDAAWTLCRFAYLGVNRSHPRVRELAERVFQHQQRDGSFPLRAFRSDERYSMIPLQASLPLRGLAAAGFATDPRTERGYEWLLAQRLEDGAWPTARAAGQPGYVAGYRKLPGSPGCRANTQAAVAALVLHPERRHSDATRAALDLLLQRETREEWVLGTEVARLAGVEPPAGFFTFYARFDLAYVLDLASRAGASQDDPRISDLIAFFLDRRGPAGLWEHPTYPELSRWLTFDLLLSLRRLADGDWTGMMPRVRFRAYRAARRRY